MVVTPEINIFCYLLQYFNYVWSLSWPFRWLIKPTTFTDFLRHCILQCFLFNKKSIFRGCDAGWHLGLRLHGLELLICPLQQACSPLQLTNPIVYEYSLNSFWWISELYVLADLQSSNSNLRLKMVSSTIQSLKPSPRQLAEFSYLQNTNTKKRKSLNRGL